MKIDLNKQSSEIDERNSTTIEDAYPDRSTYRPGEKASVIVRVRKRGGEKFTGALMLRVLNLAYEIGKVEYPLSITGEGVREYRIPIDLPEEDFRGYGLDIELIDDSCTVIDKASTALDVLSEWPLAPRYGFLSDFSPEEPDSEERIRHLSKYHINVVQFYDWMYRHYLFLPPEDRFIDGMGRILSLNTVKRKIKLCHRYNMAALAYGAVYGAEPEFFNEHPELALYDARGVAESIQDLFYIMDIRKDSPWYRLIIGEYVKAVNMLSFDGIHMDQYGFPSEAFVGSSKGLRVLLDEHFGPMIDDSASALKAVKPEAKVIFNCVKNWPMVKVAQSNQAAIYIEVWPPYTEYSDLRKLILQAKEAGHGRKQVILAAYMSPLGDAKPEGPSGNEKLIRAEAATRFTTVSIFASGGFHLLLGERDGALCDAYYPKYAKLRPQFAGIMRRYYDFFVRYEQWLVNFNMKDVSELVLATEGLLHIGYGQLKYDSAGRAGEIWTLIHKGPDFITVNLINLTGHRSGYWNFPHPAPPLLLNIPLELGFQAEKVYLASPDFNFGQTQELRPELNQDSCSGTSSGKTCFNIPRLEYWDLIIIPIDRDDYNLREAKNQANWI